MKRSTVAMLLVGLSASSFIFILSLFALHSESGNGSGDGSGSGSGSGSGNSVKSFQLRTILRSNLSTIAHIAQEDLQSLGTSIVESLESLDINSIHDTHDTHIPGFSLFESMGMGGIENSSFLHELSARFSSFDADGNASSLHYPHLESFMHQLSARFALPNTIFDANYNDTTMPWSISTWNSNSNNSTHPYQHLQHLRHTVSDVSEAVSDVSERVSEAVQEVSTHIPVCVYMCIKP
jgi:hypothetical protein